MNKLKFLKYFESFHQDQLDNLVKLNRTYTRRKIREDIGRSDDYQQLIIEIRNYDVSKFIYKEYPYGIYIKPDEDFLKIIEEINKCIVNPIPLNFDFTFSIDKNQLNLIDFVDGIDPLLRGLSLGYKLYKLIINKFYFITSNKYSTPDAHNIWYHLMLDKDLYCFTSNMDSGVIHKKSSNDIIKSVLENIKNKEIIFDDELIDKIIEIYGSVDIYKQGN